MAGFFKLTKFQKWSFISTLCFFLVNLVILLNLSAMPYTNYVDFCEYNGEKVHTNATDLANVSRVYNTNFTLDFPLVYMFPTGAIVYQPMNTFSNIAFVIAGLYVSRYATSIVFVFYAWLVVMLGTSSFAYHGFQYNLLGYWDFMSMNIYIAYATVLHFDRKDDLGCRVFAIWTVYVGLIYIVVFAPAHIIYTMNEEIIVPITNDAVNGTTVAVFAVVSVWNRKRLRGRNLWYGIGTMAIAFSCWLLNRFDICDPSSAFQTHSLWHVGCAISTVFFFFMFPKKEFKESTEITETTETKENAEIVEITDI